MDHSDLVSVEASWTPLRGVIHGFENNIRGSLGENWLLRPILVRTDRSDLVSLEASWTPLRGVIHGFQIISENYCIPTSVCVEVT
jgi:hypothetical protein